MHNNCFNRVHIKYLILIVLIVATTTYGQIYIGDYMGIHSEILHEQRVLLVHLPEDYDDSEARYPVMYLLDGDANFHHVTGLVDFLSDLDHMPQMIVIGIRNVDRIRDFTPTPMAHLSTSGGAEHFLKFLKDELIPSIDANYRTVPHRLLVGHSFSGLFSIYTVMAAPNLFNAHFVISPYLLYEENTILDDAKHLMQSGNEDPHLLYVAVSSEEKKLLAPCRQLKRIIKRNPEYNYQFKLDVIDDSDHATVHHDAVYEGLKELYRDWQFPLRDVTGGVQALKLHYSNLSQRLGYKVIPKEHDVNNIGYTLLTAGRRTAAIAVFEYNVSLYPGSANAFDSLGESYAEIMELALALENFQHAVNKGINNSDPNLHIYQKHFSDLQEEMKE